MTSITEKYTYQKIPVCYVKHFCHFVKFTDLATHAIAMSHLMHFNEGLDSLQNRQKQFIWYYLHIHRSVLFPKTQNRTWGMMGYCIIWQILKEISNFFFKNATFYTNPCWKDCNDITLTKWTLSHLVFCFENFESAELLKLSFCFKLLWLKWHFWQASWYKCKTSSV